MPLLRRTVFAFSGEGGQFDYSCMRRCSEIGLVRVRDFGVPSGPVLMRIFSAYKFRPFAERSPGISYS